MDKNVNQDMLDVLASAPAPHWLSDDPFHEVYRKWYSKARAIEERAKRLGKQKHVVNGDEHNGWYCYVCEFFSRNVAEAAEHDGKLV